MGINRREHWRVEESEIYFGDRFRSLAQKNFIVRELLLKGDPVQVGGLLETERQAQARLETRVGEIEKQPAEFRGRVAYKRAPNSLSFREAHRLLRGQLI